ncbi:MAG: G8 domain-containing protein [Oligoflexia bacterium]
MKSFCDALRVIGVGASISFALCGSGCGQNFVPVIKSGSGGESSSDPTSGSGSGGGSTPTSLKAFDDQLTVNAGQTIDIDVLGNDQRPANAAIGLDWLTSTATGQAQIVGGLIRFTAPSQSSVRCGLGVAASSQFRYQSQNPLTQETSLASVTVLIRSTQDCTSGPPAPPIPPSFVTRPAYTPGTTGLSWCNPLAWPQYSNQVPAAGANVMINPGQTIRLDCNTAELGTLHIHGVLEVPQTADVILSAASIHIMGSGARLQIGSHSAPYPRTRKAVIELTGARPAHTLRAVDGALDNDGDSRAIHVMEQGQLVLVGETPPVLATRLAESAPAGATQIRVRGNVTQNPGGWRVGDRIAIAHNDFWRVGTHEILRIVNPAPYFDGASTTINFVSERANLPSGSGLMAARFGRLQYPLDTPITVDGALSGVGYTPGVFTPPSSRVPSVLDESPHVMLLSRAIVIQAKDDALWREHRWGFHTMAMHAEPGVQLDPYAVPTYILDGVEFHRGGQAGTMARYPIHTHVLSYHPQGGTSPFYDRINPAGTPTHIAIQNNSVWESANRAITIHGTSNVPVKNNMVADILGHAIFLEDGSETRNQIIGNVVMGVNPCDRRRGFWRDETYSHTQNPPQARWTLPEKSSVECHIKQHDHWGENGSSAFWITHPENWVENNVASGARVGIWNSFANQVWGLSAQLNTRGPGGAVINPSLSPMLSQRNNISYGNLTFGLRTDGSVISEAGALGLVQYAPVEKPLLLNYALFKNDVAYSNRVKEPVYQGWTVADNRWGFAGATGFGAELKDLLIVGRSLHRQYPMGLFSPETNDLARVGMSTYHHMLEAFRVVAINFERSPVVMGQGIASNSTYAGGFFGGIDLYLWPSNRVSFHNTQFKFINSFPGFLTLPGWFDTFASVPNPGQSSNGRYFGLGSTQDVYGYFYPEKPGLWLMPDAPYFTYGLTECPSDVAIQPSDSTCDYKRIQAFPGERYRIATHRTPAGIAFGLADGQEAFPNFRNLYRRLATSTVNGVPGVPLGASTYIPAMPHPVDGRNLSQQDFPLNTLSLQGTDFTEVMEGAAVRWTMYNSSGAEVRPVSSLRVNLEAAEALPPGRHVILALPWGGAARPATIRIAQTGYLWQGWDGNTAGMPVGSWRSLDQNASSLFDFVANNPEGRKVFFDPQNGLIWVKVMGGLARGSALQSCLQQAGPVPNQAGMSEHCLRPALALSISAI